jgi:O-antigen/teichoic acid export membrane protein
MQEDHNQKNSTGSAMLKGAALLGGAALVSKLIGTLQKIPLQNIAGDEVFGLYSAVYALAIMWMTLAVSGIPTAVSVLVAEKEAMGDKFGARRVAKWSFGLLCITGLLAFGVLQAGAPWFADLLGAPAAAQAVRASSYALLVAPATAVLRGYWQGRMHMGRPAVSQIAEQTARVVFMLILLVVSVRVGWNAPQTTAWLHGGLTAGGIAGLAVMLWPRRRRVLWVPTLKEKRDASGMRETLGASRIVQLPETGARLIRRIAGVALPVAAAALVVPLFGLIDAFTIPRLLQQDGASVSGSLAQFGLYNRGIALLQLVLMAASGVAAAIVPAMARERLQGDDAGSVERVALALRMAWWIGGAAAIGLAILAAPIDIALYADDAGSRTMVWLAPAVLFGTVQAVSGGLLQGRGDLRAPAVNLASAAIFKMALNVLLVPAYGISGAAFGMVAAYAAATLLNALSLRQRFALPGAGWSGFWRSALALAVMAASVKLTEQLLAFVLQGLPVRAKALLITLPGVGIGVVAVTAALVALGAVHPQHWRVLPGCGAGQRMDRWLSKLHDALRGNAWNTSAHKEG